MRQRADMVLRHDPTAGAWPAPVMQHPVGPVMMGPAHDPSEPQLIKPILRRFWLVLLMTGLAAAGAVLYLRHAQPLYTSESRIYIEASRPGLGQEAFVREQRASYLATQAEFLRSSPILSRAASLEGIAQLKTFEGADPIHWLRKNVDASLERRTDLIVISCASPYPEDAAQIVNAVVHAYTAYQFDDKETNTTRLLSEMRKKFDQSTREVAEIEERMQDLRVRNPHMNLARDGGSVYDQQLALITHELTAAQLATIRARASFMPGHPQLRAAQALEEQMDAKFREVQSKVMNQNAAMATYAKLLAEHNLKQEFARKLDEQVRNLELNANVNRVINTVEVMEPAIASWSPSHPRRTRTLAGALVGGFLLGCVLALVRDRTDGRLRNPEEVQAMGVPVLGVVPRMSGRRTAVARAMAVHLDPRSPVAEAYRTVRTALYFGCPNDTCRTILMTSPEPGDGKTTSASNLAIAIAQTGRSVLLLDADFRKPTQHKNLDIKDAVGLSSVLAGKAELEQAIQHTGVSGLDILPCGPIPANPSEILNSRQFGELMDTLAGRYDHVIFDSPPCNLVADARILGAVCDVTILVLRADKSTKKSGLHARDALASVGARVLGAIINDAPKNSAYGQYYGSYYGPAEVPIQPAHPVNGTRLLARPVMEVTK